jgi:NADH-quinone oxidoreductase subunit K|tara:strand:- start:6581 stop:6895 length:315 start_codon:yes stop_codon:yes gene_type:complete
MIPDIDIMHFVILATIIFTVGVSGIFMNRKNLLTILMSIELIFLSININMVAFSTYNQDLLGQVFAIFILVIAGAEAAIGIAILIVYYNLRSGIDINLKPRMQG